MVSRQRKRPPHKSTTPGGRDVSRPKGPTRPTCPTCPKNAVLATNNTPGGRDVSRPYRGTPPFSDESDESDMSDMSDVHIMEGRRPAAHGDNANGDNA